MPRWMKWAIALAIGAGLIIFGWRMSDSRWFGWVLPAFFVINCFVLIVVVLLQSGKAADLAGAFGGAGSQTAFGPRGAANALSNATTWCAIMFMLCAMALVLRVERGVGAGSSILQNYSKPAPKPASTNLPASNPVHSSNLPGTTPASAPASTPATTPASPAAGSQPAAQPPASQAPASSQPASAPAKKP
jgi:preprotein translocase subunit SecG